MDVVWVSLSISSLGRTVSTAPTSIFIRHPYIANNAFMGRHCFISRIILRDFFEIALKFWKRCSRIEITISKFCSTNKDYSMLLILILVLNFPGQLGSRCLLDRYEMQHRSLQWRCTHHSKTPCRTNKRLESNHWSGQPIYRVFCCVEESWPLFHAQSIQPRYDSRTNKRSLQ